MVNNKRPEIAYVIQNILPLFASQFDFPLPEDEQNTKIDEIPIRIASGVKKPDVVYYHDGFPVFLIEAKKEGRSEVGRPSFLPLYFIYFASQPYTLKSGFSCFS